MLAKKLFYFISVVAIAFFFSFGVAFAIVAGDQGGPTGDQGPSQEEISQFEKEFGAPPEAFQTGEPEKPKFEQPGKVPDEVKQYVTDKDLVEVYCAQVRWKSGDFFSAMDAVKENIIPAMEKVRALGIEVSVPDIDSIRAEGQKRIDAICLAQTVPSAETLVQEFSDWGQGQASEKFTAIRSGLEAKMKEKGDALREKVKAEIESFVSEEKAKIESDLRQSADELAAQKQAELQDSKAMPDMDQIQNEIKQQIQAKVEVKKAEMKDKIKAKVNEIIGVDKAKFEEIGGLFQGIGGKINSAIAANQGKYVQYKQQALELRKNLVFKILDKNLEDGLKQLDLAEADIDEAKKEDSSILSAGEIKAEIQQDRKELGAKLDLALESGDESAFQGALNDFRSKWEAYRSEMEKAAGQSVSKACTVALAQFDKAKNQIEPGLAKIKNLQDKCSASVSEECLKVNEFSPRFGALTTKLSDLKTEMAMAGEMCQTPETADRKNLIALMKKIQADADDVKVYGEALDAEKSKVLADTAAAICAKVLPQLDAAENEIKKNGLTVLENNIAKCKGKTTEECTAVNGLIADVARLKGQISIFESNAQKAKSSCSKAATEEDMKTLADTLNMLKSDGDTLRSAAQDLQAKQSAQMSAKKLCRAAMPQLENAKQQIASGISDVNSIDKAIVKANASKFDAFQKQAQATLGKIANINSMCVNASTDKLDQSLIDAMDDVKKDRDIIDKMVADLKALEATKGTGVTIEAENEISTNLLPRTESWHSIKGKSGERWRPPMFGTGYWYLSRGGESLGYNFTAPKDGQYNVWARDYVDNFQPRGVRRIIIAFDGKNYGTFPETTASVPANNKIGVFAWHKVGSGVSLKAGGHAMKITKEDTTSGAAVLDSFYLTTGSEVPPEK
ncbi:MAG: hypothetical protein Q7K28_02860 [Candidatus Wildermuthbacteria bacterium]|nr:hypothetical protein [Candidatus Wildermuthbacteria bacterium]